jgi:hypothetical protein
VVGQALFDRLVTRHGHDQLGLPLSTQHVQGPENSAAADPEYARRLGTDLFRDAGLPVIL